MTDFLTADTNLPSYMMFPHFLLDMEINETAKMLYIILLDREMCIRDSFFLQLPEDFFAVLINHPYQKINAPVSYTHLA